MPRTQSVCLAADAFLTKCLFSRGCETLPACHRHDPATARTIAGPHPQGTMPEQCSVRQQHLAPGENMDLKPARDAAQSMRGFVAELRIHVETCKRTAQRTEVRSLR